MHKFTYAKQLFRCPAKSASPANTTLWHSKKKNRIAKDVFCYPD